MSQRYEYFIFFHYLVGRIGLFCNMKTKIITIMSLLSLFGCGSKPAPAYPTDTLTMRDGTEIRLTFFGHASFSIAVGEKYIYNAPVMAEADYAKLPKADIILVTHSHYDHLDRAAIEAVETPETAILCDKTSAESFDMDCHTMLPGAVAAPRDYVKIEAVAAYNTSEHQFQFHHKEREDCGYILTIGGFFLLIGGETLSTPEMLALKDIDIAFLPVNQPYTMTVDEAVEAVKALRPAIFYPYHYGQTDQTTDIERLVRELEGITEVRVRPME